MTEDYENMDVHYKASEDRIVVGDEREGLAFVAQKGI